MLSDIFTFNVYHFGLILARLSGAFIVIPGISATFVNVQARLLLAIVMSAILVPVVSNEFPPYPIHPLELLMLVGGEIFIGFFFGILMAIMLSAMQVLGMVVAFVSGLSNAFSFDAVSQSQGTVLSSMFTNLALVLIFVTDLHHLMLMALVDSYSLFVPGRMPPVGDFANYVARTVASSFEIAIQMSAPFLLISFAFQFAMGLVSRLNPQFQIFFIAMPAQLIMAFVLLLITLSGMMMVFLKYYQDNLIEFLSP